MPDTTPSETRRPRLDPAVAAGRTAVRESLADLDAGAHVVVGVSGGADSLALVALAAFVCRESDLRLEAVIVDHQLQDGSDRVAAEAVDQVGALGVTARVVAVVVDGPGGPEAAARNARFRALSTGADGSAPDAVLLAHTLDDQAETVLLGLGRGSGPRSIAGMRARIGRFRRPLLGLRRSDTEQICRVHDLTWWSDPHNDDPAFRRVRVRREVLPLLEDVLGGGVAAALARTADQVRADLDLLDALAAEVSSLQTTDLAALDPAIRSRVLRRAALDAGARADQLTATHVAELERLVTDWRGQVRVELPGHVSCRRVADRLVFEVGHRP